MRVCAHYRLAAGARTVAVIAIALSAAGMAGCFTGAPNSAFGAGTVPRDVLPVVDDAARYANLYDAIAHLRPEYLKVREEGPRHLEPVAYLNGVRLVDPTMLQLVPVNTVIEVRWVRPNQTSALYGFRDHLSGGIFVRTK